MLSAVDGSSSINRIRICLSARLPRVGFGERLISIE
jgi:hypothetical protein